MCPAETAPLDVRGFIDADIPCRKCGYDLRGAPPDGRCPECGTAVGLSIQGDLLRFAAPEWVDSLARGTKNILRGWTIMVAGGMASGIVGSAVAAGQIGPAWSPLADGLVFVVLLGSALSLWGAWQLTRPDPGGVNDERYSSARRMIRVLLFCSLGTYVLQPLGSVVRPSTALQVVVIGGIIACTLAGAAGYFVKFRYFEQLARRIPDVGLANRAKLVRRWFAGTIAALIGTYAILAAVTLGRSQAQRFSALPIACFTALLFLVLLVIVLMAVRLVKRLGTAFTEQARIARETWASAGPVRQSRMAQPTHEPRL